MIVVMVLVVCGVGEVVVIGMLLVISVVVLFVMVVLVVEIGVSMWVVLDEMWLLFVRVGLRWVIWVGFRVCCVVYCWMLVLVGRVWFFSIGMVWFSEVMIFGWFFMFFSM